MARRARGPAHPGHRGPGVGDLRPRARPGSGRAGLRRAPRLAPSLHRRRRERARARDGAHRARAGTGPGREACRLGSASPRCRRTCCAASATPSACRPRSPPPAPRGHGLLRRAGAVVAAIADELESRGAGVEHDVARIRHRARRSARAGPSVPSANATTGSSCELWRLDGLPGRPLRRAHAQPRGHRREPQAPALDLGHRSRGDALHNVVPVPVGPRIAHVRVPEPIAVHAAFVAGGEAARPGRGCSASCRPPAGRARRPRHGAAPAARSSHRPNPLWTGRTSGPIPTSRPPARLTPSGGLPNLHGHAPLRRGRAPDPAARPSPAASATCPLGSAHPVVVQSMTNTDTADAEATAAAGGGARRAPAPSWCASR